MDHCQGSRFLSSPCRYQWLPYLSSCRYAWISSCKPKFFSSSVTVPTYLSGSSVSASLGDILRQQGIDYSKSILLFMIWESIFGGGLFTSWHTFCQTLVHLKDYIYPQDSRHGIHGRQLGRTLHQRLREHRWVLVSGNLCHHHHCLF